MDRLHSIWDGRIASLAPTGFPAYGRLLHPAYGLDDMLVRWDAIAVHNNVPIRSTCDFVHVALPEAVPDGATAWVGDPPRLGTLEPGQAERLVEVLACQTKDAATVSFAIDANFGQHTLLTPPHPPEPAPDPIPAGVRQGLRMRLPGREYIIYRGSLDDALVWIRQKNDPNWRWINAQTPHFWWPQDDAWAVASDSVLPWSIIAGSRDLIAQLVRDTEIEVVPISEHDVLDARPDWLTAAMRRAVAELMQQGQAVIATTRGSVVFRVTQNDGMKLESGGGWARLHPRRANRSLEDQVFDRILGALMSQLHLL